MRLEILHRGDRRRQAQEHEPDLLLRRPDPVELGGEVTRSLVPGIKQRLDAGAASDHSDLGAVLVRDVVEIVRRHHAAGARHVLHDHERMPRQMTGQERTASRAVEFVTVVAGAADHELDLLSGVELLDRLAACRPRPNVRKAQPTSAAMRPIASRSANQGGDT